MSKLHVVEGPLRGKIFEVTGPASVGRGETCAVRLDGRHISRVHARIEMRGSDMVLIDSGSRNGIFVNGQVVKEAALRPDDQIEIGEHVLVFDPTKDPAQLPRITTTILEGLTDPFAPGEPDPRLPQLAGVAASISTADDPREIARMLLDALLSATSPERGIVMVMDADGKLRPAARMAPVGGEEFYLSNLLHHEVSKQRRAVIATDAARREGGAGRRVGILSAPLLARKTFVGLVYLESKLAEGQDRPAFRPADLRFAAALCAFAGARIGLILRQGPYAKVGEKPLSALLTLFEKECLVEAVRLAKGDLNKSAQLLGLSRASLDDKIRAHGLAAQAAPPPDAEAGGWKSVQA